MTAEEKVNLEHRLTEVTDRARSNTKRLDEHDILLKENSDLVSAIKELAVETKYMREDLNDLTRWREKMESKDDGKWEKFKWHVLTCGVTIILSYLAVSVGLK